MKNKIIREIASVIEEKSIEREAEQKQAYRLDQINLIKESK